MTYYCNRCKTDKPISNFYVHNTHKCKDCVISMTKQYKSKQRNPEIVSSALCISCKETKPNICFGVSKKTQLLFDICNSCKTGGPIVDEEYDIKLLSEFRTWVEAQPEINIKYLKKILYTM